ncbi:HDOD domain-containing protein [Pseudomonas sp. BMS12]|uniref:HDOD domain-containing protein n=1 Tax=Pseudomonas sp. BMS12 TaxID=1796033 RepID=UPI00083ABE8C|nr:HDOD domain-containing protein [Pseudomonas sp. BMS12]
MSASAISPEILIAEADPWTAELLTQLVLDVRGDARIQRLSDGTAALASCKRRLPDLVIADGELPGIDGIELLRQLRRHPRTPALPCILISRRVDASSVRAVLPLAPTAYLARPFNAELLRQRIANLLPAANGATPSIAHATLAESLEQYLDDVREEGQGAPLLAEVRDAVSACLQAASSDLGTLARDFARDPQITARLIAAANSAAEQRSGICQTLAQALQRLGVAHSLNLVLGMAIQRNARLQDPRLSALASQVGEQAQRSAELAHWLAAQLRLDHELCYTAGLLHNIGELALLRSLQDWQNAGGELSDGQIAASMKQRASGFGSALRMRWRLPLGLRELIAAFYQLGSGVFSREALVLNLCAVLLAQPVEGSLETLLESRPARLLRLRRELLNGVPAHLLRAE